MSQQNTERFGFAFAMLVGILMFFGQVAIGVSQEPESATRVVSVSSAWSVDAATPGQEVVLALAVEITDGYYIGNCGEEIPATRRSDLMPTTVELTQVSGAPEEETTTIEIGTPDFPRGPTNAEFGVGETGTLVGRPIIYVPIRIDSQARPEELEFVWTLSFQACDEELCLAPDTVQASTTLTVVESGTLTQGCPQPELFLRWSDRRAKLPADRSADFDYKSKEPPIGPPWVRDLRSAQSLALETGRPIFLYSTKTFCPHCVVVESEMLSAPELKSYYDRAVFLYVYRDFSGSELDRQAERVLNRYSLSSWPQLWLIEPRDLSVIRATGRTVSSFASATNRTSFAATSDLSPVEMLDRAEERVVAFESSPSIESAQTILDDESDVVLQIAAARYLVDQRQQDLVANRAQALLQVPNDLLRYVVLQAIKTTGAGDAKEQVEAIAIDPTPSRNYNVLRARAIEALATCGDAASIDAIEEHARGSARNMTTRISIDALVAIAERDLEAKDQVVEILINSFPAHESGADRLELALATTINNRLEELTGRAVNMVGTWNESSRDTMRSRWQSQ